MNINGNFGLMIESKFINDQMYYVGRNFRSYVNRCICIYHMHNVRGSMTQSREPIHLVQESFPCLNFASI